MFRREARANNQERSSSSEARRKDLLLSPPGLRGQIPESLAGAAISHGVKIQLNRPVDRITVSGDSVEIASGDTLLNTGNVLSSIPLPILARALSPSPPEEVVSAINQQRTRGMLIAHLVVPQSQYTSFDAHYFPGLDLATARLSEAKNYRTGDDPPDLTVYVPNFRAG